MALFRMNLPSVLATIVLFLLSQQSINLVGALDCEDLTPEVCAFAVSSSGRRCVLEQIYSSGNGPSGYKCQKSEIEGERKGWVETDECVKACGLDRMWVGVSSDALQDASFTRRLCSAECYSSCPNVAHLYFHLAAAEGIYLPKLCEAHHSRSRFLLDETLSSAMTSITVHSYTHDVAPATSPSP
eukprot:TRINITY_DN8550_c0_g1_i1.p1 TRINITY_DN8550_c0_g1~~TRINITY_DN8550_c0_g1_i1.p1  ORF type:complete len:208 (+),score=1.92 TRINITY_DN8550_c0_g1_i1:70-624(+)